MIFLKIHKMHKAYREMLLISYIFFKALKITWRLITFLNLNSIRFGLFQTVNDPGGGGFKSPPPPPTISKTIVSIFTIWYMWILPGLLGMIQLEFFKNSRF